MRHLLHSTILASTLGFLLCETAKAESPYYFRGTLGGGIVTDIDVEKENADTVSVSYVGALGLAGGWNFNSWLGAEIETGVVAMDLDRLSNGFDTASAHGSVIDVPFTANLVLRYERPENRWSAYLRGGAGGAVSRYSRSASDEGIASSSFTKYEIAPAYRVGLGGGYRFSEKITGELGYELFGTGGTSRLGPVMAHIFQVGVKYSF